MYTSSVQQCILALGEHVSDAFGQTSIGQEPHYIIPPSGNKGIQIVEVTNLGETSSICHRILSFGND